MSQDFKFKFDRMRENAPHSFDQGIDERSADNYDSPGHGRNLCFAWPDGRKLFLSYGYLVSGEYRASELIIELVFTSHIIVLRGIGLEYLFTDLLDHLPRIVRCVESRYNTLLEEGHYAVNEINTEKV